MARSKVPELNLPYGKKRWRRRMLIRGLTVVVILAAVLTALTVWLVRALPRIAAAEIGRLTNTRIETGAFDFHRDASVSIDTMVIRPRRGQLLYDDTILRAENVYAKFSLGSVLLLSPQVTEIRIEDFTVDVQLDLDTGQWNVGGLRLNAPQGGSGAMPTVLLRQGKLRYSKVSGGATEVVMSVPVEARFGFVEEPHRGYNFDLKTSKLSGGYGQSHLSGYWRPGELALAGGLSSTDIPSLERAWAVDVLAAELKYDRQRNYALQLRMQNVHSKQSPEVDAFRTLMAASLERPGPLSTLQRFFARYRPSGTLGEITLEANGNLDTLNESRMTATIVCKDVSIRDRNFPYAVDQLAGRLELTQSMVIADELSGKHGDVDLLIRGWTRGYGDERQYQYRISSDNMVLDEALYAALQPEQKQWWDAFKPRGTVGVDYRLVRTSPIEKRREVSIDLHDVAATYEKFPYPLEGLTGKLYFDHENIVASDIVSQAKGRPIRLNAKVTQRHTDEPMYYVSIDANNIPLDTTLEQALSEPHRRFLAQFDANGVANVQARVFTSGDANDVGPISYLADVSLTLDSLTPRKLPLTVSDVSAEASVTPNLLNLKKLTGRYGQAPVSLTGSVQFATDDAPSHVRLMMTAEEAALNEKLIGLLPDPIRQSVAAFHPEGRANLTVEVRTTDTNEPADYTIALECLGNTIEHERFGYPLHDVRGTVTIGRDGAEFQDVTATVAGAYAADLNPSIRINGYWDSRQDARDIASFTVSAREVPFSRQLGEALPQSMAGIYRDLSPRGPFDLTVGTLQISNVADSQRRVVFDGTAGVRRCSLTISGAAAELSGALRVQGVHDTKLGFSSGRMSLDAERFTVKGKSITDLKADIILDPNTGRWSAENFLGDCYDGRILGNFQVAEADQGVLRYLLEVAFHRVALQPFLLAGKTGQAAEKSYTSGTMNAALSLGARVGDGSSRLGICRVHVVDMQVGKVSPLGSLLSVLRLSEPRDYTFEQMLIESYLRRNTLLIEQFDMSGRDVAFAGSGTMDLPTGEVDLTLTARGRRVAATEPTVLQSLTEGLGHAVVRMEVTGQIDDPQVETKALPVIEDSLRILGTPR